MASRPSVFLDANVLLEILLKRRKSAAAQKVISQNKNNHISILTCHLVVHFGSQYYSMQLLEEFLDDFIVLPSSEADVRLAFKYSLTDYEDGMQLATAIANGMDQFVTFDKDLHKRYRQLSNIEVKLLQ